MTGIVTELQELIAMKQDVKLAYRPQLSRAKGMGSHVSRLRGRGMDFDEVRSYQAGDDIRHMEWRVTARTGTPHVKLYREENERPVILLVDFNPSMYFATQHAFKSVVAARLAALLAWTAIKHQDRVGGLIFSPTEQIMLKPRSRNQGVLPLLNGLSRLSQTAPSNEGVSMSEALKRIRHVAKPASLIYLISDFKHFDADSEHHLARLSAHMDLQAFNLKDTLEVMPPKPGSYSMSDGKKHLILDTRHPKLRQSYQQHFQDKEQQLADFFNQYSIPLLRVMTTDKLVDVVHKTYCQQSRRQYG